MKMKGEQYNRYYKTYSSSKLTISSVLVSISGSDHEMTTSTLSAGYRPPMELASSPKAGCPPSTVTTLIFESGIVNEIPVKELQDY